MTTAAKFDRAELDRFVTFWADGRYEGTRVYLSPEDYAAALKLALAVVDAATAGISAYDYIKDGNGTQAQNNCHTGCVDSLRSAVRAAAEAGLVK